MTDLDEIAAATQTASNRAERIATATREARAAQAALVEKVAALTAAQVALGSSLPATAVIIVGENPQAEQSFRDAVIAASVAVPAAQAAGGSGDAELLAYAAAVTALRADQARAQDERSTTPVTPPSDGSGAGARSRRRSLSRPRRSRLRPHSGSGAHRIVAARASAEPTP